MYLHIGNHIFIREKKIIGIFDTDNATISGITRKYLSDEEKKGNIIEAKEKTLPKSFVLFENDKKCNKKQYKIYFSQLSSTALARRSKQKNIFSLNEIDKE